MLHCVLCNTLITEVLWFRAIKGCFKQLQEQMEELKDKMWDLLISNTS